MYRSGLKKPAYLLSRSADILEKEGIRGVFIKSLLKIRSVVFSTNSALWFKKETGRDCPYIRAALDVNIDFNNSSIIQWLSDNHRKYPWFYIPEEIRSAESNRHVFAAFVHNNSIIGYIKIGIKRVYILDFDEELPLPGVTAFIYDTFILPEYRGRNIVPFALVSTINFLRTKGIREIFCHIPRWNRASINAFAKAGFENIRYLRFLRLFKFKFLIRDFYRISCRMDNLFYEFHEN